MIATLVLVGLLLVASITDVRWRRVYNWTTYPGILVGVAANGVATVWGLDLASAWNRVLGCIGLYDSVAGCVGCGFIMLVCYVFFPGGVGGGDVKLLAMMGAFLGPWKGLESLLWTFVFSACSAIVLVFWRFGTLRLLGRAYRVLACLVRYRTWTPLPDEDRELLKTDVLLFCSYN
jgi:prepilin peptidase CpaA